MFKIDIHTHILPPNWPDLKERYGYGGFLKIEHVDSCSANLMRDNGQFFRAIQANCWDAKIRMEECQQCGIHLQVLSTVPVMFNYWAKSQDTLDLAKYLNDHIAGVVQNNPRRFVGLGTLPLQDPDLAIRELERCMKDLGLAGIQIGSHVNDWNLDEDVLFPVFEAAQDLGAALFVHPWDMLAPERMKKYWLPWLVGMPAEIALAICSMIFGGVLERLPRLRVAFAHGGGAFPMTLGRIEQGFLVRPDLCAVDNPKNPRDYLGKFYVDSLVHDPEALKYLIKVFGEKCIALGSDYPFPLGEDRPGELIEKKMDLTEASRKRIFSGTALEWLNRKEADFAI